MTPVALSLGSNEGDRMLHLRRAMLELFGTSLFQLVAASSVYETDPVGDADQPPFLNAVLLALVQGTPGEVLAALLAIEKRMGRIRDPQRRFGPRRIDLDLLLFGTEIVSEPDLVVPHPRLAQRAFVLVPLAEIAPMLEVPGTSATVAALAARVGSEGVRKVEPPASLLPFRPIPGAVT